MYTSGVMKGGSRLLWWPFCLATPSLYLTMPLLIMNMSPVSHRCWFCHESLIEVKLNKQFSWCYWAWTSLSSLLERIVGIRSTITSYKSHHTCSHAIRTCPVLSYIGNLTIFCHFSAECNAGTTWDQSAPYGPSADYADQTSFAPLVIILMYPYWRFGGVRVQEILHESGSMVISVLFTTMCSLLGPILLTKITLTKTKIGFKTWITNHIHIFTQKTKVWLAIYVLIAVI